MTPIWMVLMLACSSGGIDVKSANSGSTYAAPLEALDTGKAAEAAEAVAVATVDTAEGAQ